MFTIRQCAALLISAVTLAPSAALPADDISKVVPNTGDLKLQPLDDLPEVGKPSLINGIPVSPKAFPASFHSEYRYSVSGVEYFASCTATLVGRRVLLTAAHCVGNGKTVYVTIKPGGEVRGECTHHSGYKDGAGDESADYALCLLKANAPVERAPETLTLNKPAMASDVLLAGYGCTTRDRNDPTGSGTFRVGLTKVKHKLGALKGEPNSFITYSDPNAGGGAVLCPGDSGGAAYQLLEKTSAGSANPVGRRLVIGVNSRQGTVESGGKTLANGDSYLSATRAKAFASFVRKWQKRHGVKICGVDEAASKCRSVGG